MARRSSQSWRPGDLVALGFFALNLVFVTYMIDLEQIVVADPANFAYPVWPPRFAIDAIQWWGRTYDPLILARPTWYKATIWIDSLFFGPFYAWAVSRLVTGRMWLRPVSIVWAAVMLTNVTIILAEEAFGLHRTPAPGAVFAANAPWLLVPLYVLWRATAGPSVTTT